MNEIYCTIGKRREREDSSDRRYSKKPKDGRVVDIVDSLSSLLEGKPPGFFHFLIHAPSSHEYFVGNYFLNHLHEESAEEGFVIIADWKQFYKEQNAISRTIPQIKQAYFSVCSAEDYKNDPLAFENILLTALQDEWNLLYHRQISLSVAPVASPDSIYSSEETKLSAILKTTDAPSSPPYVATSLTFSKTSPPSTPLLLPTDTSDCEAFSSLSSLPTPLCLPPLPSPCLPLILYLRLASSCLQIGGLNSCAAIIGQDKDIKALITRSKICVNENTVREPDSAYKLISYPLNQINDLMFFDREENDTRRWPPIISYKIKRFIEYARSAPELDNLGDLSLFVCVQKYSDGYAIDLPGGRRNLGESMDEALRRETIEESGIVLFSENFSEYDDDHPSCQFKIDEFVDSDMCFHVIHQDVYHIESSISLSHSSSLSEPPGAYRNVPVVSSPLDSPSSSTYIPN